MDTAFRLRAWAELPAVHQDRYRNLLVSPRPVGDGPTVDANASDYGLGGIVWTADDRG